MAQYDVHRYVGPSSAAIPYLLEIQADLLSDLATRVVVPLIRRADMVPAAYLNPMFQIEGQSVVMSTQEIASYPARELSREIVANLADRHDEIVRAIDFLLGGY